MVSSKLGKSKYRRPCVLCREAVADRSQVYRADPKRFRAASYTERGRWSSSDIRDAIVCMPCVESARKEHAAAGAVAADVLADLLRQ